MNKAAEDPEAWLKSMGRPSFRVYACMRQVVGVFGRYGSRQGLSTMAVTHF